MRFRNALALMAAVLIFSVGTGVGKGYINHRRMRDADRQIMDCIKKGGVPIIVDYSVRVCLVISNGESPEG